MSTCSIAGEPNSYRHFHRHSADTTSLVLEGELHVIDVDPETGAELSSRIRKVGDYAHKGPGDVHMERGGPEGALVLFSLYAPDGLLAETLTKDGSVLSQSTTEPILAKSMPELAKSDSLGKMAFSSDGS